MSEACRILAGSVPRIVTWKLVSLAPPPPPDTETVPLPLP